MKRKLMQLFICAAALLLSGCGAPSEEPEAPVVRYTVAFYDGGEVLQSREIEAGQPVEQIPPGDRSWLNGRGEFVDPAGLMVEEDMVFYAWHAPVLRAEHDVLFDVEGERFYPGHIMSRGEAAVLICSMVEDVGSFPAPEFSDVVAASPEHDAIQTAVSMGLMSGYPDGTFRPRGTMTQGNFATLLYRLAGMPGLSGAPGRDWTEAANNYIREQGWTPIGKFKPGAKLTRRDAAVMAARFRGDGITDEDAALACPASPFADVKTSDAAYSEILDTAYRNELLAYITGTAERARPGIVTLDGRLCHVNADTLRLDRYEAGIVTVDGALYRVSEDGYFLDNMTAGLWELDGAMYYVPEDGGPFLSDGDYGYLHFGEDGRYTSGSQVVDDAVDELLADILRDDSLSRRDKLYRGYCAVRDGGFFYRTRSTGWRRGTTSWALGCAEVMLTEKYGTCYYWASAFLYVARRVGYQAFPVCGGVGTRNQIHAWVVVVDDDEQKYICDVELEWAYSRGFYDGVVSPTNMFMQPLYATKVIYVFPGAQTSTFYSDYGVSRYESNDEVIVVPPDQQMPEETEEPEQSPQPGQSPEPGASASPSPTPQATVSPGVSQPPQETPVPANTPGNDPAPVTPETPAPTPEPTAVPATPEPTPVPATPEPTPAPTPEPAPTPVPASDPVTEPDIPTDDGAGE